MPNFVWLFIDFKFCKKCIKLFSPFSGMGYHQDMSDKEWETPGKQSNHDEWTCDVNCILFINK